MLSVITKTIQGPRCFHLGFMPTTNLEQRDVSTSEAQPIAFKATEEKDEPTPTKRLPIDASKLENMKMALITKSFQQGRC
jgi:hypothetical protein